MLGGGSAVIWAVRAVAQNALLAHSPDLAFILVASGAVAAAGLALQSSWRTSVLWGALSISGYVTALHLVDAGTAVLYQHLRPAVAPLSPTDWRIVGALAACVLTVAVGLAREANRVVPWIREHLGWARSLIVLATWACISASPLRNLEAFALEIALSTVLALAWLGAVLLAVLSVPDDALERLAKGCRSILDAESTWLGLDRVAAGAAGFVFIAASTLVLWSWERHPHLSDEISFLFHATYFARGELSAPGVPIPELFAAYQIECRLDRCISVLQPGWPALLAVGVAAGAPWLVNPLLAGLNVLLFFAFVREIYDRRLARGAVLLLATSPWYLFLGMSFMNHQATLTGGLVAVLGTTLAVRGRSVAWAAVAGAGAGFTSLMRPMDGVIVAGVASVPLFFVRGSLTRRSAALALFGIGTGAFGSLNLVYNHALTGNPFEFPVNRYLDELWGEGTNDLGFGPDRGVYPRWAHMDGFPGHSPFQAVVNAALNVTALQVELFGWATGSFLPLLLLAVWYRLSRTDWLLVGWLVAINALYALYWFASGPDFAARYWFLAVVPLCALTARGLQELGRRAVGTQDARAQARLAAALALGVIQATLVFIPWRGTDKYYRYFNTGPDVRDALQEGSWPPGVYVVRGANQPDYAAAMIYAAPDLAGGRHVFVFDSLPDTEALVRRAYPDAAIRWLDGPSLTGGGYRVYAAARSARESLGPESDSVARR